MGMPEAIANARAGLQDARQELERLYALTRDDPPEDRARRHDIIQKELAQLNQSEARLDVAERSLRVRMQEFRSSISRRSHA
jgi:hypothetical protein